MLKKLINNKLFKGMSLDEINNELNKVKYKVLKYEAGETIAFRGEEIKGAYINISGELVAEMMNVSGDIKKIEDIDENQIIASAFIFGGKNVFPVDLVCKTSCKLLFISKSELLSLVSSDERLVKNLLDEISNKAQFLSFKIWSNFTNKTISEKLANFILEKKVEDLVEFKPSLKEISNLFSVARPSLSRVLGVFIEEGILERNGKTKYRILDFKGLEAKKK